MANTRKRYSAGFKAKVAIEALKGAGTGTRERQLSLAGFTKPTVSIRPHSGQSTPSIDHGKPWDWMIEPIPESRKLTHADFSNLLGHVVDWVGIHEQTLNRSEGSPLQCAMQGLVS